MKLRVAFDATTVAFEKKTGTGVYSAELIRGYESAFPGDEIYHTYRLARAIKGRGFFLPRTTRNIHRQILQDPWTFLQGYQYDIFHGLNARLPVLAHAKKVVTIHDLFSLFSQFSDQKFLADQKIKIIATLSRADHIITPAQFTKNQLMEKLNVPESKISVVGEGVGGIYLREFDADKEFLKIEEKFKISKPYFLSVGTIEKRKNTRSMVEAFYRFDLESPGSHLLVLVGGRGFAADEVDKKIKDLGLDKKVIMLGHTDDEWLASLYRAATALLFLSWEEGYGIPVIEAMACGLPVISSNTTSLPEVGAGHTYLVDPSDTASILKIMCDVAKGSVVVESRRQEALVFARKLTWTSVAKSTREVYEKVRSS